MDEDKLLLNATRSLSLATVYAFDRQISDSHWCGEVRSNVTVTAEYVFLYHSIGKEVPGKPSSIRDFIVSQQNNDGSWGLAPGYPGDVSTSSEAYLALKMLGESRYLPHMQRAQAFIRSVGGVAKVRIFTRIFFAQLGLLPWKAIPAMPAEFILIPSFLPMNVYTLASWARSTIIPLLIIRHHERIYPIKSSFGAPSAFLDELWLEPDNKLVPYSPPLVDLWRDDLVKFTFSVADKVLVFLGSICESPLRRYALRRCVSWIVAHQEKQGDWAGILMPMICSIQALLLEGYSLLDPEIQLGLEAIERFAIRDRNGGRIQPCVSPVWDTALMLRALCDAGIKKTDDRVSRAIRWLKSQQLLGEAGDWRIYCGKSGAGGFSFEYFNTWYPDIDDTAAAILAIVKRNPESIDSTVVTQAVLWICAMQNKYDGGWGAFDVNNNKEFFNKIPFSDMNALCDPSTADVTGHVLETFGSILQTMDREFLAAEIFGRIQAASDRAIRYLSTQQESRGSWYGRWGVNHIYGTSSALCGLSYFAAEQTEVQDMVDRALEWLIYKQNKDGGWGEGLESYQDGRRAGDGSSTPSQTAWAVMGLLSHLPPDDCVIKRGIAYLICTQTDVEVRAESASWTENAYTGTGFAKHFYFGYELYRHYFPMMALGRYVSAVAVMRRGTMPRLLEN